MSRGFWSYLTEAKRSVVKIAIVEINERTQKLVQQLLDVWEKSVRATHTFYLTKKS